MQMTPGVKIVEHPELVNIPEVDLDDHVPDKGRRRESESPSAFLSIVEETALKVEALDGYMHVPRFYHLVKKLSSDYSLVPAAVRVRDLELFSL